MHRSPDSPPGRKRSPPNQIAGGDYVSLDSDLGRVLMPGEVPLLKKKRSTKPRAGRDHLRKGKWTVEEEDYTTKIIHYFSNGILTLPEGITLRAYLSQKLNCDPMRITKKYAGASCLGKRVYHLSDRLENSGAEFEQAKLELAHKEKVFRARVENTSGSKYYVEDVSNLQYNTNIVVPENYISTPASSLPGPPYGSYRNQPVPTISGSSSPFQHAPPPLSSQYPPYHPAPHFHPHYMHQYPRAFPQPPAQQHLSSPPHLKPSTPTTHSKEDRDLGSILLGFMNTVRHNHPVPPSPPASTTVTSSDISDTNSSSDSESYHHHHQQQQQPQQQQQYPISGDSSASNSYPSNVVDDDNCNTSFTSSNVALHTKTLDEEFKHKPTLQPQSAVTSVSGEGELDADSGAGDRSAAVLELDEEKLGTVKVEL